MVPSVNATITDPQVVPTISEQGQGIGQKHSTLVDSLDEHMTITNNNVAIDAIKQLNHTKRANFEPKTKIGLKLNDSVHPSKLPKSPSLESFGFEEETKDVRLVTT